MGLICERGSKRERDPFKLYLAELLCVLLPGTFTKSIYKPQLIVEKLQNLA